MSLPSLTQELLQPFSPYQTLAQTLLPLTLESDDGSHDVAHLHRVWKNCRRISKLEGGDRRILCAAVLLHDAVAVEKNSPQRHLASRMAAQQATLTLTRLEWSPADIAAVAHAIEAHSFSAGIPPANAGSEDPAGRRSSRRHWPDWRSPLLLYRRPHAQRAV